MRLVFSGDRVFSEIRDSDARGLRMLANHRPVNGFALVAENDGMTDSRQEFLIV